MKFQAFRQYLPPYFTQRIAVEKSDLLARARVEQVEITKPNFIKQFILLLILRKSDRFEKVYSMLSLLTFSLLGFEILGAFTYHYGDIDDDSEVSFSDIAEDTILETSRWYS